MRKTIILPLALFMSIFTHSAEAAEAKDDSDDSLFFTSEGLPETHTYGALEIAVEGLADSGPSLSKAEFQRLAAPNTFVQDSSAHSMARVESPEDPWFIKEQRDLIKGKKFTLAGVLTFRSHDLPGKIITKLTHSDWSHSGLLVRDEEGNEYCFESTGSAGQIFQGMLPQVQIHRLQDIVASYAGEVGRRNIMDDGMGGFVQNTARTTELVWDWLGVSYEKRPLELLSAIKEWNKFHKGSEMSLFCSEMTALMLQQLGYLPYGEGSKPASNFVPRNFGMQDTLELLHGRLSDLEILKTYADYKRAHPSKGCAGCVIL